MATLVENANRIAQAKADIKTAIENKGVTVSDSAKIETYPALIDQIDSGVKVYTKSCWLSEGTWTGVTLSDSSWVNLATDTTDSTWRYYHNLNLDLSKVVFMFGSTNEPNNGFRITRGYAKNSSTAQYQYTVSVQACVYQFAKANNPAIFECRLATVSNSNYSACEFKIILAENYIDFKFINNGRNFFAIKATDLQFYFTIGYTE